MSNVSLTNLKISSWQDVCANIQFCSVGAENIACEVDVPLREIDVCLVMSATYDEPVENHVARPVAMPTGRIILVD